MRILISGSHGLIGSALVPALTGRGHRVSRLVRSTPTVDQDEIAWDPSAGTIDRMRLDGIEAVVHLAGERIAGGRWTPGRKATIRDSRINGTHLLCNALARLARPPAVFVGASAIGYYGDRGDERLYEDSPPGSGFLAEVCQQWEAATSSAARAGLRVVNLRIGVVLSAAGGALKLMQRPFRLGLGGTLGNGRQYMSWIALDDVVGAIESALAADALRGPVNAVAPHPVTNRDFTKTLGRVLSRPTIVPVPAAALRLAFGEMADEALLASTRVEPAKLLRIGYRFQYPELEGALRHVLGIP